ncbi:hypothetical protein A2755_02310 [Candidatus Wolfebacteria bacterium RIFCSPHIGHO2_01_FULL_48_22]|uniref:Aspartate--tRNA(Asp/Asn) ligase n=2 Tax=Candidatus Wolfeibacteriota TaxID=1752735 RepID=A0A1F8DRF3_9BACT|nr:MAG: hypothetical protein A2755_02310 [Candidatus Wolfebacteria bacterium RIFCSPHIGHO2_01_FULL_48_22]OGM92288.1 MAG: hypothetical protein A2935_00760 [Candidatus Wolfebacteria bacterium RIFCSPLOWO2_01_FULL_47_17b]
MSILEILDHVGEEVELRGLVAVRRDHGKLIFINLRDRSGSVQAVFGPWCETDLYEKAKTLRSEWVVKMRGLVKERPENMQNPDVPTGKVEFEVKKLEILNEAATPVFDLQTDGYEVGEETRMQYRYLDLRRERLQKNIALRHRVIKFIRDYLDTEGFYEIETPILTKSTPEGARDYVVPSRLYPGSFYALPQSPQQYKQLLMAAGFEKYFQIARCFRDEDTRGDRQPEFTQLDLEMSFVEQEDVMRLNEELLIALVSAIAPDKKIKEIPFPRLTYAEAMEKYKTDRPDLREDKENSNELAFCWIVDFPFFTKATKGEPGYTFTHNPFSAPKPEHMNQLMDKQDVGSILTTQYDVVLNGYEIGGGSIRAHQPDVLRKVFEIIGYEKEQIEKNFGHMLTALASGAPPHGGIAWGLDRLLMILAQEKSIRDVIAFPKTGDARDLMMESPSALDTKQLDELHLKINKKEK